MEKRGGLVIKNIIKCPKRIQRGSYNVCVNRKSQTSKHQICKRHVDDKKETFLPKCFGTDTEDKRKQVSRDDQNRRQKEGAAKHDTFCLGKRSVAHFLGVRKKVMQRSAINGILKKKAR